MTIAASVQGTQVGIAPPVGGGLEKKKLTDAAQQFEAMFLEEMLKPLRAGCDGEDGDKDASPGNDTMSSFGTEAVAKSISQRGGFGIAKQIVQKVMAERLRHEAK